MGVKLAALEAVLRVGVNFAAVWFAIDKKVGAGERKDWWSGRRVAWSQSCAKVHDVSHILLIRVGKGRSDRSTMLSF